MVHISFVLKSTLSPKCLFGYRICQHLKARRSFMEEQIEILQNWKNWAMIRRVFEILVGKDAIVGLDDSALEGIKHHCEQYKATDETSVIEKIISLNRVDNLKWVVHAIRVNEFLEKLSDWIMRHTKILNLAATEEFWTSPICHVTHY